jgi:hypothetical protein
MDLGLSITLNFSKMRSGIIKFAKGTGSNYRWKLILIFIFPFTFEPSSRQFRFVYLGRDDSRIDSNKDQVSLVF